MTIFLHIGTGKTGTTTIQTFLENNRAALAARGLMVPGSLGRQNHRRLTLHALNDDIVDNLRRAKRMQTPERVAHFRGKLEGDFAAEVATWPRGANAVMTSEQLTRLRRPGELERLKQFLAAASTDIRVIVYLRRQDDYFASEYSQLIKGGMSLPFSIHNPINMPVYSYVDLVRLWGRAFGDENIIVRPFEREQLRGGDLLGDFMSIVGIDDLTGLQPVVDQNLSLDAQTVEFLRLSNDRFPRWVDGRTNRERLKLVRQLESISTGPKLRLSGEEAGRLLERFAAGNAEVARRYLGREDGRLFERPAAAQEGTSPSLSVEQAVDIAARLWTLAGSEAAAEVGTAEPD